MNVFLLMDALRSACAEALADLPLVTRDSAAVLGEAGLRMPQQSWTSRHPLCGDGGAVRAASVHVGTLAPAAQQGAPFVLIQAMNGHEDDEGFAHVTIALRVCVANEEGEGAENDLHNLIACLRRTVLPAKSSALMGRYILEPSSAGVFAPWTRPDEQAPGFAEAYIMTDWKMQGS